MSVLEKVTDLAKKLTGARDAVAQLRDADQALRGEHAAAEADRVRLLSSQPPKDDLICEMEAQVDALAEQWRRVNADRIIAALAGGVDVLPHGEVTGVRRGRLTDMFIASPTFSDIIAMFPDQATAALRACIESAQYTPGPSLDQRVGLIAKVDARIVDLEQQHARLVDSAAEAGITLEHLDRERTRRLQAMPADQREHVIALDQARPRR